MMSRTTVYHQDSSNPSDLLVTGGTSSFEIEWHQPKSSSSVLGKSFEGMTQSGLSVSRASSSGKGINLSGRVLIFERWAAPVSSDSERCISFGIGMSSKGCSDREADFFLEELEGASRVSESLLEDVEEDLGHHGVSYETWPLLL
ncbi:hypothetical protein Tco_0659793 [Tanacetum coccineum]